MIGMGGGVGGHRGICSSTRCRRARGFIRCKGRRFRVSVCSSEGGGLEGNGLLCVLFKLVGGGVLELTV